MQQPNDWIEWKGGECPVPESAMVQILCADETPEHFDPQACEAGRYDWSHDEMPWCGNNWHIIAYRLAKASS